MKRAISIGKNLPAGVETMIYKVPIGYTAEWILLYFHNTTASAKDITVTWRDESENVNVAVLNTYPSPAKEYFKFNGDAKVAMDENDEIRVTTEATSNFGIICTFDLERKA